MSMQEIQAQVLTGREHLEEAGGNVRAMDSTTIKQMGLAATELAVELSTQLAATLRALNESLGPCVGAKEEVDAARKTIGPAVRGSATQGVVYLQSSMEVTDKGLNAYIGKTADISNMIAETHGRVDTVIAALHEELAALVALDGITAAIEDQNQISIGLADEVAQHFS